MTGLPAGVSLEPRYFALAGSLRAMLAPDMEAARAGARRLIIGVAGESGSGKSVTALCLARELEAAGFTTRVLHQDDYFRLPPRTNHEHRVQDLANVGPHEVNLDLLRRHLAAFRAAAPDVVAPVVDYPANTFLTQRLDFSPVEVLIVEGTYVLTLPDVDIRVFLEATHEATRGRRQARGRDIDAPIIDRILAIEHDIIAAQAASADIVITPDFTPGRRRNRA